MKRYAAFIIVVLIAVPSFGASLWREKSLYTAGQQLKTGDVIVIAVDDITRMRFTMNVNSKNSSNVSSTPDVNITGFLPKVSADSKTATADLTDLQGKGDLNIEIAAQVAGQTADGKYQVQGVKEYVFNGVSNRFEVSGIIDPALMNGRSIRSTDVVNFRLGVSGTKEGLNLNIQRPALKPDETPKAELTNDEKQRLIIDYLTKMLSELSR